MEMIETPILPDEQVCILEWARRLRTQTHINVSAIISKLISEKPFKPWINNGEYLKARDAYFQFNSWHKDNVLMAILLDNYRRENDVKNGQIVTDGELVGVAGNIDYKERTVMLFSSKDCCSESFIVKQHLDLVKKVK